MINLKNNETVIMSAEKVLIVSPKSFIPLKFGFQKIQGPGGYEYVDEERAGVVYTTKTSEWNDFYLVTEYLTNEGITKDKKHIRIK